MCYTNRMIFTVIYRDRNGEKVAVELEAADKAAVWPMLRERGITALSVAEAAERPRKAKARPAAAPRVPKGPWRGLVAAFVVVALSLAAWWLFIRDDAEATGRESGRGRGRIAETAPAQSRAAETETETAAAEEPYDPHRVVKVYYAETNANGVIEQVVKRADGSKVRMVGNPEPVLFTNPSDQAISIVLSVPPGREMPPTPMEADLEAAFEESLKIPIEISEDDPPEVRAKKLLVSEARKEIAQMRKSGRKVVDILQEHIQINNENAQVRDDALRELRDICREGDFEGAEKYLMTMNVAFQQMGIPEIEMPATPVERRRQRQQEEADAANGGK